MDMLQKVFQFLALAAGIVAFSAAGGAEVAGTLQWASRAELSTPVSGVVGEVHVNAGDRVRKGQPLITLDQRTFQAELEEAIAGLAQQKALRAEARRELERSQELYDRTLLSQHELEVARIADANAEAAYREAQAMSTRAQVDLDYSVVRAPFDGLVLARPAFVGQTVVTRLQPMVLVVVADAKRFLARIAVSEDELDKLSPDQRLRVRVGGHAFEGAVQYLGLEPSEDEGGQGRYPVDIVFVPDVPFAPRAGQRLLVTVP